MSDPWSQAGVPPAGIRGLTPEGPVLVTGASGFLGAWLVALLCTLGVRPRTLGRRPGHAGILQGLSRDLEHHAVDLRDGPGVRDAVARISPRVVFHLAAFTSVDRTWQALDEVIAHNLLGTLNLLDACRRASVERFVHVGTCEEYGDGPVPFREDQAPDPVSPYSAGKASGTLFCRMMARTMGFPAVCLRPFLSFGPGQDARRFVPQAMAAALARRPLPMTAGDQTREWNYAPDLVRGIAAAGVRPGLLGEVVNVGSGHETAVLDMAGRIFDLAGAPRDLLRPGLLPKRPGEATRFYADTTRCTRMLGYSPSVSLDDGLRLTLRQTVRSVGEGA